MLFVSIGERFHSLVLEREDRFVFPASVKITAKTGRPALSLSLSLSLSTLA